MQQFFSKLLSKCKCKRKSNELIVMDDEPVDLNVLDSVRPQNFHINKLEVWRINKFKVDHALDCPDATFSYKFGSSGIGPITQIRCDKCGVVCDVTDVGSW